MSSKDISSMLNELMAHESALTRKKRDKVISATSLNDIDNVISEQFEDYQIFGLYGESSKDGLLSSANLDSVRRGGKMEKDEEELKLLGIARKSISTKEKVDVESYEAPRIPTDGMQRRREVSFSKSAPRTVAYNENAPLAVNSQNEGGGEEMPKEVYYKSILKASVSDTQPCEVPMEPKNIEISSNDEGSSFSDTSASETGSDEDDQVIPSDEEDEDIDIGADDNDEKIVSPKFRFETKSRLFEIDSSLSLPPKSLSSGKPPSNQIKSAPSFNQSEASQITSPVFLYFGHSSNSTNGMPPTQANKNSKIDQSGIKKDQEKQNNSVESDDDDNVPLIQTLMGSESGAYTQGLLAKLNQGNLRKITTRIYIEVPQYYQTKTITSIITADQVQKDVIASSKSQSEITIDSSWSLFELNSDSGMERPLRDWEIVTDVISAWSNFGTNVLIMKKYGYQSTLSLSSVKGIYPKIQGFLYLQLNPEKWQKRFVQLRKEKIFFLENQKDPDSWSLLCDLSYYDVYTSTWQRRKTPTPYCFSLRSDMNESVFSDNLIQYIKYLCVEKEERLIDWVLALRMAKSERMIEISKDPDLAKQDFKLEQKKTTVKNRIPKISAEHDSDRKLTPGSLLENLNPLSKESSKNKSSSKLKKSSSKSKKKKPLLDF